MMTWAHGLFRQRLQYKMIPVFTNEHWTTKVCSECGSIDYNVKDAKVYHCQSCGATLDRDANGAKNVLLKWMIDERGRANFVH